jgi:dipeptidyl aminopeptidase/acylaminoacyl peptidase
VPSRHPATRPAGSRRSRAPSPLLSPPPGRPRTERYPHDREAYAERSPINHVDRLSAPVIFFQGAEDRVVPPKQTELMVTALKERGVPVGYLLFDGSSMVFGSAENIRRALDTELYFTRC